MSRLDIARAGGRDFELLEHYRTAISRHIAHRIGNEDIFETQARSYPPVSELVVLKSNLLTRIAFSRHDGFSCTEHGPQQRI
jgi:hypothetical protein